MSEVKRERLAGLDLAAKHIGSIGSKELNQRGLIVELESMIAQASAAPEQEAVGYFSFCHDKKKWFQQKLKGPEFAHLLTPLYTHAEDGEVERLRAENKELTLKLAQSDHNYDCDRDQFRDNLEVATQRADAAERKLGEREALLEEAYREGWNDGQEAIEQRYQNSVRSSTEGWERFKVDNALLSANAEPAECELMTFAQFVEKAASILDEEQGRLSEENYLMDSEDCIKVLREHSQPAEDQNDE